MQVTLWTLLSAGDFRVVVISDERTTPKDKILSKHIRMWHFQVRLNPIVIPESDRFKKVQLTKTYCIPVVHPSLSSSGMTTSTSYFSSSVVLDRFWFQLIRTMITSWFNHSKCFIQFAICKASHTLFDSNYMLLRENCLIVWSIIWSEVK